LIGAEFPAFPVAPGISPILSEKPSFSCENESEISLLRENSRSGPKREFPDANREIKLAEPEIVQAPVSFHKVAEPP
jgi:hypothetical protein